MDPSAPRSLIALALAVVTLSACSTSVNIEVDRSAGPEEAAGPTAPSAPAPTPTASSESAAPPPSPVPTSPAAAAPSGTSVGQCYTAEQLGLIGAATVPCSEPHVAEVFAVTFRDEPADAPWPTLDTLLADASAHCNAAFADVTGVAGDISAIDIKFFRPDESSWTRGDREVACFVDYPDEITAELVELDPLRAFGRVSSYGLADGDCVSDANLSDVVALTLVDCSEAHTYEVYASLVLDDGPYPGDADIIDDADEFCEDAFEPFVGVAYSSSSLLVENLWPTEQSWTDWGDRLVTCAITFEEPLSGSAQGTGR